MAPPVSFVLFALFAWGALLIVVVACIRTIWRAVTLPRGAQNAPACEACGYDVAGLTTFLCPECGRDTRITGIITPAMEAKRRGSLFGALGSWTVLAVGAGLFVWIFVIAALESRASGTSMEPLDRSVLRWRAAATLTIPLGTILFYTLGTIFIVRRRRKLLRGFDLSPPVLPIQ